MSIDEMMAEIREVNLSYLMLAQQMLRQDVAELLESLSPAQILKLARSGMLLSRFRFDDGIILDMLANYTKDRALAHSHAAILMAGQAAEQMA
jgi:flagellar transcriptional activator FlhD